jgi:hypothetical protein
MLDTPLSTAQPHTSSDTHATDHNTKVYNYHLSHLERLSSLNPSTSFSIGAHNVNSFCQPHKQISFRQAVLHKQLDFVAILDTRLRLSATRSVSNLIPDYQSFWSPLTSGTGHGGIGLYVKHPYNRFVQSLQTWKDLMLSVDLFMPSRKLRIIIIYCPPCSPYNNPVRQALLLELSS